MSCTLLVSLLTIAVLCGGEGDHFNDLVNNQIVNCSDMETETLHRTLISVENVAMFGSKEMVECAENKTVDISTYVSVGTNAGFNYSTSSRNQAKPQNNPTSPAWYVIFKRVNSATRGIISPIISILALIGNILFITVLCKGYVRSSSSVYLLGMSGSDVVCIVLNSPFFAGAYPSITALRSYQTFNAFHYSYVFPISVMVQTSSNWVILFFTIERFFAVAFPMKAKRYVSARRSRIAVFSAFVFGFALNFVRLFRQTAVRKVDSVTEEIYYSHTLIEMARNKTIDAVTFWSYTLFNDIIPFLFLLVLNTMTIHQVWRARYKREKMSGNQNEKENESARQEHQITRLLIAIVVGFLVCNLPACIASVYAAINTYNSAISDFSPFVYYLYTLASFFNSGIPFLNCILYAVCNETMRNGVVSVICGQNTKPQVPKQRKQLTNA